MAGPIQWVGRGLRAGAVALLLTLVLGCGGAGQDAGVGHPLSVPQLKYRLIDRFGPPLFCGPPVVHWISPGLASREVASLRAQHPSTYDAIVDHQHLDPSRLDYDDELTVLHQVSVLDAIELTRSGGRYRFAYVAGGGSVRRVSGTEGVDGGIHLASATPTRFPPPFGCPL